MPPFPQRLATTERLSTLLRHITQQYPFFVGFPAATDFDYQEIYPFFDYLLNNIGDPYVDPLHKNHTKEMEREVIAFFADLFRAPQDDRWGYITSGSTEGNLYALYVARTLYPQAVVYYSQAAHYSIPKNIHILGMASEMVAVTPSGEANYEDLRAKLRSHAGRHAIVVANIGTTMTEAKDNVAIIRKLLREESVGESFIHCDAALAGAYTPLLEPHHPFDFADGADSICVSGHKFIGSPMPCGVVVTRMTHRDCIKRSIEYIGSTDTTIAGSRNGHTPIMLWYAIQRFGIDGLKARIKHSLELAEYIHSRLLAMGWEAWRNKNAITVMLKEPPVQIVHKWQLATHKGWSHVVCMPGITQERLDAFVADLARAHTRTRTEVELAHLPLYDEANELYGHLQ